MDAILDAQLERMETALGTLLTSIITYNPNVSAADELLLADDDLSRGLEQRKSASNAQSQRNDANATAVTRHHNNYTRILQLRHEAELLDSKIKTSVQLLADIRKDLFAIPLDAPREPAKPVQYKTLLNYARNISSFTVPPTFRPKPASADTNDESKTAPASQGGTRAGDESALANSPPGEGVETAVAQTEEASAAQKALSEEQQAWLAELKDLPFQPWPGEEQIRNGALQALHHQVVNGNDPTDLARVIEEERYAADQKRREDDEEARKRGVAQGQAGRVQASRPAETERQKARFGLDDDSDDDD